MLEQIIGHTRQRHTLLRLVVQGALPSALAFTGPAGIGKALVAKEIVAQLFCKANNRAVLDPAVDKIGPCGSCGSCRRLASGNLPDCHWWECNEQNGVEAIRTLLSHLSFKAFEGGARAVVLNDADQLTPEAANALLKSLEEPLPATYFILIMSNPSKLPTTVLSRCQSWYFDALTNTEIESVFALHPELLPRDLSDENRAALAVLADGSVGSPSALITELELWPVVVSALANIADGSTTDALSMAIAWSTDKAKLPIYFKLIRIFARQQLQKATCQQISGRWAQALSDVLTAEHLVTKNNLSARYVLTEFLLRLSSKTIDQNSNLAESVV